MTNIQVTVTIFSDTQSRVTSIDLLTEQEKSVWCCVRRRRFTPFLTIHLQEKGCPVTVEEEVLGLLEVESIVKMKLKQGNRTLAKTLLDASRLIEALLDRRQYGELHVTLDISQSSPLTVSLDVTRLQFASESLVSSSAVTEKRDSSFITEASDEETTSQYEEVSCAPKIVLPSSTSHHTQVSLEPREEEVELARSLWGRITFLTKEELEEALQDVTVLGRGAYGEVWLARYEGEIVAIKTMDTSLSMLQEARLLLDLDGAGGMPRALAVCLQVSSLILEYVGHTYDKFLARCSVGQFMDSLVSIVELMEELHARDIVHNDLKANNITFSGTVDSPVFHIIDCGLACRAGQVADCCVPDGDEALYPWLGPELKDKEPVFPSHDVFSLGALISGALRVLGKDMPPRIRIDLHRLAVTCRGREPSRRPDLNMVAAALRLLQKELPCSDALPEEQPSVTHESDWATQVLISVSSTSHLEAMGDTPQRLDDFSTSYPQQVVSAPTTLWAQSHHRVTLPPSLSLDTRLHG